VAPGLRVRGWDTWARLYPGLEYAALGRTLQHARAATVSPRALARLPSGGSWLLLGDGDGRGLAKVRDAGQAGDVVCLDVSPQMLARAQARMARARTGAGQKELEGRLPPGAPHGRRPNVTAHAQPPVTWCQADLLEGWPAALRERRFDVVVTQFFLDCFTDPQIEAWWPEVARRLRPGGVWLVTDFTPAGSLRGWQALRQRALLAVLYPCFRWTTPMVARALPDLERPFRQAGWQAPYRERLPSGITELTVWRKPAAGPSARPTGG